MGSRLSAIDVLRGAVILLMIIDHTREYSAGPGLVADPMDLSVTSPLLFFFRWATHFCAPVFAFLMGVSAWFSASRRAAEDSATKLLLRGVLLILLEFTLVDWSWTFYPLWPRKFFQVIGALGAAMIGLAAFARIGERAALVTGLVILAGHNLLDGIRFAPDSAWHYLWSLLHQRNVLPLGGGFEVRTTYPILPICAIAWCGFGSARWLFGEESRRRLAVLGATLCALFVVLRTSNLYGDPSPFVLQATALSSAMGFLNVTKYPVSLQFALMTLGPALLILSGLHARRWKADGWLSTFGRVPLFVYVLHLYLLHLAALAAAWAMGFPLAMSRFATRFGGIPEGFGFPLGWTPAVALLIAILMLPAARRYDALRRSGRYPVLSYF